MQKQLLENINCSEETELKMKGEIMGFWIFMLCMDLMIPGVMILFGWIFLHKPPREINGIYGYRTSRSMASQEAWDFAHQYMGKLWLWVGLVLLVFTFAAMLPCMGKEDDTVGLWGGILCAAECVIMMLPIIPTEKALKKTFG